MSKTFIYMLAVIGVYLVIVFPKVVAKSNNDKEETEKTEETKKDPTDTPLGESFDDTDENGVSQGASGQLRYRIGHTN